MLLDHDPGITGIASQSFWLFWQDGDKRRSHAPDYFARRDDGSCVVIDCRPANRIKPRDAATFEITRRACQDIGWSYELLAVPDPVPTANVRWLAGYRHPRHAVPGVVAALMEVFTDPSPLMAGAHEVGDPIAVLPVLFHLMGSGTAKSPPTAGCSLGGHQPTGPPTSKKLPVGPSASSVAARTTTLAPCAGCCASWLRFRSVLLDPGHTELTLTGVSWSSTASHPVSALRTVLDAG